MSRGSKGCVLAVQVHLRLAVRARHLTASLSHHLNTKQSATPEGRQRARPGHEWSGTWPQSCGRTRLQPQTRENTAWVSVRQHACTAHAACKQLSPRQSSPLIMLISSITSTWGRNGGGHRQQVGTLLLLPSSWSRCPGYTRPHACMPSIPLHPPITSILCPPAALP